MNHGFPAEVAVIGAGPYGVSIAAHLRSAGVEFRIFGRPIHRWQYQMPAGMFLKSDGCASNLSDPTGYYTLERYCLPKGLPYRQKAQPVSRQVFAEYALSFQRNLVPSLEDVMVTNVDSSRDGFRLHLANGEIATFGKVILATGLEGTAYIPSELGGLPSELLSHSENHHDLSRFKGRDVTVIGGGQSAIETAALLGEEGAFVRLVLRKPSLVWSSPPTIGRRRSFYQRLRHPVSGLGVGLELWGYCTVPELFRYLPQRIRHEKVRSVLGPSAAWWLKDRVLGRIEVLYGLLAHGAEPKKGRAALRFAGQDGRILDVTTDHVIAATGYRFSLQRLPFLSSSLKSQVRTEQGMPELSSHLESSVRGLYFTGLASAGSFGPAMRFLHGAHFTARRVSQHIASGLLQFRPAVRAGHSVCGESLQRGE